MNRTLSQWGSFEGALPCPDDHRLADKIELARRQDECGQVQETRKTVRFDS